MYVEISRIYDNQNFNLLRLSVNFQITKLDLVFKNALGNYKSGNLAQ